MSCQIKRRRYKNSPADNRQGITIPIYNKLYE
nr:MAG TPA: hypothetical protein [Caudoviricetes sp.]